MSYVPELEQTIIDSGALYLLVASLRNPADEQQSSSEAKIQKYAHIAIGKCGRWEARLTKVICWSFVSSRHKIM
jgi:hypothetical protein